MVAGAAPPAAIIEGMRNIGINVTHVYGLTETMDHLHSVLLKQAGLIYPFKNKHSYIRVKACLIRCKMA